MSEVFALDLKGVSAHYGGIQALRDVSLKVEAGTVTCVIGANGAGKSTLINCISGLVRGSTGVIWSFGQRIDRFPPYKIARQSIIQVPEGRQVFGPLTVEDNLYLGSSAAAIKGRVERERIEYVYEIFPRLRERRHQISATLSGGEQQMLAIGRGLMGMPKILLLDEPSLGLAPVMVNQVYDALNRLREHGLTMLLVEQNALRAVEFSDECYVLRLGSMVWNGPSKSVGSVGELMKMYL